MQSNPQSVVIGIDTSNYTTSAAVYDLESRKIIANLKLPLRVSKGERGLRQSDAVFAHVKNLPEIASRLREYYTYSSLCAVGCSISPRRADDSYMPCFLTGKAAAEMLASGGVPLYEFSHQEGHIEAALRHTNSHELDDCEEFIAFHVSGGTTEVLHVKKDEPRYIIKKLGGTLDISAGQLIDRTGVLCGLEFPCGPALERLADEYLKSGEKSDLRLKPSHNDIGINISGAENKVADALRAGHPTGEVALFVENFIADNLILLTKLAHEQLGKLPILFAGGVMSNKYIKGRISEKFDAAFAPSEYSSDNACGIAMLAARSLAFSGFGADTEKR